MSLDNTKTILCKSFTLTGKCKFGKGCSFAHGKNDLRDNRKKSELACWWYNNGGCNKSDSECMYVHKYVKNIRKPMHLQHPCIWMHVKTPGFCKNGNSCGGDHDYELLENEWIHHFPNYKYKGVGYLNKTNTPENNEDILLKDFPNLPNKEKVLTPYPIWGIPLPIE